RLLAAGAGAADGVHARPVGRGRGVPGGGGRWRARLRRGRRPGAGGPARRPLRGPAHAGAGAAGAGLDEPRPRGVVAGAGFGGSAGAGALRRGPVDVVLLDRNNYPLFTPLLYQVASALLSPGEIAQPVRKLVRPVRNCEFRLGEVTGLDLDGRQVLTD